jgi:UDP-N-acetylmuramoyl-L-alanyl-D-glutamate--2,6-diaminopimelate ligase
LYKAGTVEITGSTDIEIAGICLNSKNAEVNTLFVAVRGTNVDGHIYIPQAIANGSVAVVCEEIPTFIEDDITYIVVPDSARALGQIASNFFDNPSSKLHLVGVTGTNGKTTIATLLYNMFRALGFKSGLLSTVRNKISDTDIPSTHTTPDPVTLNHLLSQMVESGCQYCFMEVSSHAVVQERIAGLEFAGAIFTNITHDHLDYHKTFDNYIKAKKLFFDQLPSTAFALVNADDRNGDVMLQNTKAKKYFYSLQNVADFHCRILENQITGLHLTLDQCDVYCRLVGEFNAYNLTAIYGATVLLGQEKSEVLMVLSRLEAVEGRFEYIRSKREITAIVDYAHTPDALKNILLAIRSVRTGGERIITVVGAGGDRDSTKRPMMAKIAAELSDKVILTSDNPRSEDPEAILTDMTNGLDSEAARNVLSITNRREAIKTACIMAQSGDIILLAGKGHEKYQEINGVKHPFDDKEVITAFLNED